MTLSDRIAFQRSINPEINEVWLPADKVQRLTAALKAKQREVCKLRKSLARAQAKADANELAAQAHHREMRRLRRRREAIPQPRRKSIAAQIIEQDSRKDRV